MTTSVNSFIEQPRFPDDISYGSTGGAGYVTDVVVYGSGFEQRNPRWPMPRHKYNVAHGLESQQQLNTLLQFFHIAQGRAYGFRYKDWADYQANSSGISLTAGTGQCNSGGVGTGSPYNPLYKKYGPLSGSVSGPYALRRITKPVSGTLSLYRGGSLQTLGLHYTVDTTSGMVTLVADLTRNITSISNLSKAILTLALSTGVANSSALWISGVAGMTQVNSQVHYVNSVIDPTHFVLGTNTTTSNGYGVYTSSGAIGTYAQPSETLTAEFEFDVPTRFETDEMHTSLDAPGTYSWGAIPVWELRQG